MKIILLQNIKNLGKAGDVKDVSGGYARNFLFPRKLAVVATEETLKENEAKKSQEKAQEKANLDNLKSLSERLRGKKISLECKEKDGKLFGSVSTKDIAKELEKENLEISEKCIIMNEVIKNTGQYKIKILLAPGIESEINLEISGGK